VCQLTRLEPGNRQPAATPARDGSSCASVEPFGIYISTLQRHFSNVMARKEPSSSSLAHGTPLHFDPCSARKVMGTHWRLLAAADCLNLPPAIQPQLHAGTLGHCLYAFGICETVYPCTNLCELFYLNEPDSWTYDL
jgi:hypothetical protein